MAEVSVIVPVYQVKDYIAQCIESVLAQTFTDWELILADDGSTDGSGEICDRYAAVDDRIAVLHSKNRGAATARNAGLARATGRYITFLDGDDYWAPHTVERLLCRIRETDCDVAACDFLNLLPQEKDNFTLALSAQTVTGREVIEHLKNERNHGMWTIVWNKIYKRALLEGVRFPDGRFFEDEFFSNRLYPKCNRIEVIPEVLCYHRVLASSTMNTQNTQNYLDLVDAFAERLALYFAKGYSQSEAFKVLVFMLEPFTKCVKARFDGENGRRVREARAQIRSAAKRLLHGELPLFKKCALVSIYGFPAATYRVAVRFRGVLEKFL